MSVRDRQLAYPPDRDAESWLSKSVFDGLILKQLKDLRDLGGARMMMRFALGIPVAAASLYVEAVNSGWLMALYLVFVLRNMDRFILGMHVSYHRPWFRNKTLNKVMPNFVGLFFGQSFGTYWAHHLAMHHPEDNEHNDLSTTQPFQRDSAWDLLWYLTSFVTIGIPQLIVYFFKKGRSEIAWRVIRNELATWAIVIPLAFVSLEATAVVFLIPIAVARTMMMFGNWGQHAFVRPEGDNAYTLGTTLTHTNHNRRCFNNGYHALHHQRQALHWSLMPQEYERLKDDYARSGSIVFDGVPTFQVVTLALITRQYAWLERHLVRFEGDERSAEERMAFLKERTRPYLRTEVDGSEAPVAEPLSAA